MKICGITNIEDAVAAVDAGADALGFMFFENSKRNVPFDRAAAIIRELPPFVAKIGVFVNATEDFIRRAVETGIDTLQLHGDESPEFCEQFSPLKVVKAFRVRDRSTLEDCLRYRTHAWLLDSYVSGAQGGTGVTFDWDVAAEATKLNRMIILAGGLKPETVADAVRKVRPFGVDVSSGVESGPWPEGSRKNSRVRRGCTDDQPLRHRALVALGVSPPQVSELQPRLQEFHQTGAARRRRHPQSRSPQSREMRFRDSFAPKEHRHLGNLRHVVIVQ